MTDKTLAELDRIATALCALCRNAGADLDDEDCPCNDCRPLTDLANLVERLEEKHIVKPLVMDGEYTCRCPGCGALYGLSNSRDSGDTEYCSRCGQLTSGWMKRSKFKEKAASAVGAASAGKGK